MLKREDKKLAFRDMDACENPLSVLRITGLDSLDEATLLGALLGIKAYMNDDGIMEAYHNKGCDALRVLNDRKDNILKP